MSGVVGTPDGQRESAVSNSATSFDSTLPTEKAHDDEKFLSPINPEAGPSISAVTVGSSTPFAPTSQLNLPNIDLPRFDSVISQVTRINGDPYSEEVSSEQILKMLEIGRIDDAVSCADLVYSQFVTEDRLDIVAFANFMKVLTVLRQWRRICVLITKHNLHQIHLVFAYYIVKAMFHRHLYEQITELPIGHLVHMRAEQAMPLRTPSTVTGRHIEEERAMFSFQDMTGLDRIAEELRLAPALMLVFAESFLKLMNSDAAMHCISYALKNDTSPIFAERLMTKHNLVHPKEWEQYLKVRNRQLSAYGGFDPRMLIEKAKAEYNKGRFMNAKKVTDTIFDKFGPHADCMLVRIHCLTMLGDSQALFELAHQLVEDDPHVPIAWYCVALYYYAIGQNGRARTFIGKCTMMDITFSEAWIAFGHILHFDAENEQSMSCYYRASKLVDRCAEPYLYVALQYCTHSQKLCQKFMEEAVRRAPFDPLIKHEEACIAYMQKKYTLAEGMFKQVLFMVTDSEFAQDSTVVLRKKIEPFWKSLVNNLGHVARKLGRFNEAIVYYQRAITLDPKYVDAIAACGMCHAILGETVKATEYFNRALAISPFNEIVRMCISKMVFAVKNDYDIDTACDISKIDLSEFLPTAVIQPPNRNDPFLPPMSAIHSHPLVTLPKRRRRDSDQRIDDESPTTSTRFSPAVPPF